MKIIIEIKDGQILDLHSEDPSLEIHTIYWDYLDFDTPEIFAATCHGFSTPDAIIDKPIDQYIDKVLEG